MSTFTAEASKKKWADDSDSSDGEEIEEPVVAQEEIVSKEESSDDESESEDDTEKLDMSKVALTPVEVKKDVKPLSKKEKKELKQKELDDLDSLLAEFGTSAPETPVPDNSTSATPTDVTGDAKDKKKKKKKPTAAKKTTEVTNEKIESEAEFVPVADINAVLKSRTGGNKKSGSKAVVSDAQKIALAEAKKSDGQKKKRDKSKFCEGTY